MVYTGLVGVSACLGHLSFLLGFCHLLCLGDFFWGCLLIDKVCNAVFFIGMIFMRFPSNNGA